MRLQTITNEMIKEHKVRDLLVLLKKSTHNLTGMYTKKIEIYKITCVKITKWLYLSSLSRMLLSIALKSK